MRNMTCLMFMAAKTVRNEHCLLNVQCCKLRVCLWPLTENSCINLQKLYEFKLVHILIRTVESQTSLSSLKYDDRNMLCDSWGGMKVVVVSYRLHILLSTFLNLLNRQSEYKVFYKLMGWLGV
jgi:hypothetical protein